MDWLIRRCNITGLFIGTSLFGYICDQVGRRKMFLIDIVAIGAISVATMFCLNTDGAAYHAVLNRDSNSDYPIATSMITEFSNTKQRICCRVYCGNVVCGATCANRRLYVV